MSGNDDKDKQAVSDLENAAILSEEAKPAGQQLKGLEIESLLNPSDFQSTVIHVALMNPQAKIEVREGFRSVTDKKGKKITEEGEHIHVRFVEFTDKGLMVEVPRSTAELSHSVMMRIELKQKDEVLQSLNVSGRVTKIEILPDGYDVLDIELTQFGPKEWANFKGYFSNRQTEIETLFEAMKGR
jgi:hypothetical protein